MTLCASHKHSIVWEAVWQRLSLNRQCQQPQAIGRRMLLGTVRTFFVFREHNWIVLQVGLTAHTLNML